LGCFCCDGLMKKTMARRNEIKDFEWRSAAELKGLALAQPDFSNAAGQRYPTWVTDDFYKEYRDTCQYVANINWSLALPTATQVIADAKQQGYVQVSGDWTEGDVRAAVGKYSLGTSTEEAAVGLILEPIQAFDHGSGLTFENGNHRAIVLGVLLPEALVPAVIV
jgi:hypothetical protein